MNYLAHIYLSYGNPEIQVGNFMADFIKGDEYKKYPLNYQKGVLLHRKIDRFTDTHPLVAKTRAYFFDEYRHYASVIVDVLFDHLLAKHWDKYHTEDLFTFTKNFYDFLSSQLTEMPIRVQKVFPIMQQHNWLYNYKTEEGIEQILFQMNQRTAKKQGLHLAMTIYKKNLAAIEANFFTFFEDLENFTKNYYSTL